MSRVVILGSEGMLGSVIKRRFAGSYEVVGLDHRDIDVTDQAATRKKLIALKPDMVINATAYNSVDEAEKSEAAAALAERINGTAVGELAIITQDLGIPLVHFSTEYVFDGTSRAGYAEDDPPRPVNFYGETKALGERLLRENTERFYLVRLSRMFGPPGTSAAAKKSFVDIMLGLVELGKTDIRVVADELSCPTYSLDAAGLVFDLIANGRPYGIYHGANTGACSWFDLAKKIFELKHRRVNLIAITSSEYVRPAQRPLFSELLNTKLAKQRPWEAALAEYLV